MKTVSISCCFYFWPDDFPADCQERDKYKLNPTPAARSRYEIHVPTIFEDAFEELKKMRSMNPKAIRFRTIRVGRCKNGGILGLRA